MFDLSIELLIAFINIIPILIAIILSFNLISDLLWGWK